MTVPATSRKAGPFNGNGSTTAFPFTFKVFTTADVQVVKADALGAETTLVLDSHYSVALNPDQDATPGGTVTYPISGSPLAVGEALVVAGAVEYEQETDIPTGGDFNPTSLENALDKIVMQVQQLYEQLGRAVKVSITSDTAPDDLIADITAAASSAAASASAASASASSAAASYDAFDDRYLGSKTSDPAVDNDGNALLTGAMYWNNVAQAMRVYNGTAWGDVAQGVSAPYQTFSGNGVTTAFTLSSTPGSLGSIEAFIGGVRQAPGTDYTWTSGTTLTFTSAPPAGTNNVFVRWINTHGITTPADGSVTPAKLAAAGNEAAFRSALGLVIGTDVLAPNGSGANLTGFKKIAQIVRFESQSLGSSATTITLDDSIPQITEGDQFITQAFTPVNAGSTIYVRVEIPVFNRNATAQCIIAGLFLNDDTNAKAVASVNPSPAAAWDGILTISKSLPSWSGAKTLSVRMGGSAGSLFYTNGRPAALGTLGARQTTSLEIIEVLP